MHNIPRYPLLIVLLLTAPFINLLNARRPLPLQKPIPYFSCINYEANVIKYPADSARMEYFYKRLDSLALFGKGQINIVHIGGSHVQADVMTHQLRRNMTGLLPGMTSDRGLLFPFRAARTNNPTSYKIEYTGKWEKCQNSLPPIDRALGICGIAISTEDKAASICFNLNPDTTTEAKWQYNRLTLMATVNDMTLLPILIIGTDSIAPAEISHDCTLHSDTTPIITPNATAYYTYYTPYSTDHGCIKLCDAEKAKLLGQWNMSDSDSCDTRAVITSDSISMGYEPLKADSAYTTPTRFDSLEIGIESDNKSIVEERSHSNLSDKLFTINGFIPYTDETGIVVHSVGVNGASLPSWLRCSEFEHQMGLLKPDLVLLAVGVNDANVAYGRFDTTAYIANYNRILEQIYRINPDCAVIFITNNDCVLRTGRYSHGANRNTALVASAMRTLAKQHNAGIWDLYDIMGGFGSMAVWRDRGLANKDRVHFLAPGYRLLGDMLFNAIIYDWLYKPGDKNAEQP